MASVEEGGDYGFIDKRGVFVIPPKFGQAQEFSSGLAFVRSDPESNAYFIDKTGRAGLLRHTRHRCNSFCAIYPKAG